MAEMKEFVIAGVILEGSEAAEEFLKLPSASQAEVTDKDLIAIRFIIFKALGNEKINQVRYLGNDFNLIYNLGESVAYCKVRSQGELISWERSEDWETVKS